MFRVQLSKLFRMDSGNLHISKELNSKGKSPFDINVRSVLAMRETGGGYSALEKLRGYLNLSHPVQLNAFNETKKICFRGVQYCSIAIIDRCSS